MEDGGQRGTNPSNPVFPLIRLYPSRPVLRFHPSLKLHDHNNSPAAILPLPAALSPLPAPQTKPPYTPTIPANLGYHSHADLSSLLRGHSVRLIQCLSQGLGRDLGVFVPPAGQRPRRSHV